MQEQGRPSLLVTVTSGLAIVPGPWVPNYCATKAALHSFTISLATQLRDTKVKVVELFPPYVHTVSQPRLHSILTIVYRLVESELHDRSCRFLLRDMHRISHHDFTDQGTTERLSKVWMPLADFTKEAMDGLKRGDDAIPVGLVRSQWETHEKGKLEKAANTMSIFSKSH